MKSLQFDLQITCDNDAFSERPASEIAQVLRETATRLEQSVSFDGETFGLPLKDTNGNTVGTAKLRHVKKRD